MPDFFVRLFPLSPRRPVRGLSFFPRWPVRAAKNKNLVQTDKAFVH
jgi:hypothetical protein